MGESPGDQGQEGSIFWMRGDAPESNYRTRMVKEPSTLWENHPPHFPGTTTSACESSGRKRGGAIHQQAAGWRAAGTVPAGVPHLWQEARCLPRAPSSVKVWYVLVFPWGGRGETEMERSGEGGGDLSRYILCGFSCPVWLSEQKAQGLQLTSHRPGPRIQELQLNGATQTGRLL